VERLAKPPGDGPFLVCATSPWAVLSALGTTINANTPPVLVKVDGKWVINTAAKNVTYKIYDNNIANGAESSTTVEKQAGCKAKASDFNGAADSVVNKDKTVPSWFTHKEGSAQGQIVYEVEGVNGCKPAQLTNCVMLLPLAVNDPPQDDAHAKQLYVVAHAAFYITMTGSGNGVQYFGRLVNDYLVSGPSEDTWVKGDGGIAVIRLIK
ncbi:MAG: hypothetical protein M3462_11505, partial [Chloroflexota bacterium]|nr:hypothetical protein [Chloroflexota bacterium]